jgi:hypothetical protein
MGNIYREHGVSTKELAYALESAARNIHNLNLTHQGCDICIYPVEETYILMVGDKKLRGHKECMNDHRKNELKQSYNRTVVK